jgi:hypothetical protein
MRVIIGNPASLPGDADLDSLSSALSPDGRYLVTLHQTSQGRHSSSYPKLLPDGSKLRPSPTEQSSIRNWVEFVDLTNSASIANLDLGASVENLAGAQIGFGERASDVYLFTVDRRFRESLTHITFDGARLAVEARGTDGVDGKSIPSGIGPGGLMRIRGNGQELVRYVTDRFVQRFDTQLLSATGVLEVGDCCSAGAKPVSPFASFSPDGDSLLVANAMAGKLYFVHLDTGKTDVFTVPSSESPDRRPVAGTNTAALLTKAGAALLVDTRNETKGIWGFNLSAPSRRPDLVFQQNVKAISIAGLGQGLFALGREDGLLYVLEPSGSILAIRSVGRAAERFVDSESR